MKKHVFMMPHPPIIMEEIGRKESELASCTITGMKILANRIAEIQPDTIIFITPHGNSFSNGTCLLHSVQVQGNFGKFGQDTIQFSKKVDLELTEAINEQLEEKDILSILLDQQLASKYQVEISLDHGVMVPMYFIDKEYSDYKIVHITPGFTPLNENFVIGKLIKDLVDKMYKDSKVVFIASGDLSHALSNKGPYGFHKSGPEFDTFIQEAIIEKDPVSLINLEEDFIEEAAQCGLRSIIMGFGFVDGYDIDTKVISYEGPFGVGYMTGYLEGYQLSGKSHLEAINQHIQVQYEKRLALEDDYIKLARHSIEKYIYTGTKLNYKEIQLDTSFIQTNLKRTSGAFVSIHKNNKLRGCIGTIEATADNLIDEIIYNGISACSNDPRFHQVEKDELPYLDIKVDILFPKEKIMSKEELNIKEYGVIVEQGYKRGLLLPNIEGIHSVEEQIQIAKQKASIVSGEIDMYRFKVERHEIHRNK